jgi:hypothetical protein
MAVRNSQHIGFWLLIMLLGFMLGPLMRSGESMERYVRAEISETRSAMGLTVANYVVDFANGVFRATPLAMIAATAQSRKLTDEEQKQSGDIAGPVGAVMSSFLNSYLQGLALQSYVAAMRFAIAMVWIIALAPMLIAAAYDGFMQRRIKRSEFGAIRPSTFTVAGFFVIPLLALPALYMVLPFSISPLLAPAWAFVVALPLSLLVSNMQPLFGR